MSTRSRKVAVTSTKASNKGPAGSKVGGVSSREKLRLAQELAARRKKERRLMVIVAIALVVLVVGGGTAIQKYRTSRAPTAASAVPSTTASPTPQSIVNGKPILLGKADAPVRISLYEDFHCPHCADFEEEFGPTLTAAQAAGTVVLELYPMSFIDSGSTAAANAMACAAEAGLGQAYYLGLFANHTLRWQDSQLLDLASKISSSVPDSFKTCVTTKVHSEWVQSINQAADANNVNETPTMFLNGDPVTTSTLTPESLEAMIEQAVHK